MTDQISELRATAVDMSGLMAVLSKNLYSTPNVAVRELVQNAHDSIVRRRLEDGGFSGVPGAVRVIGEPATQTLRIIDTGAGLTEEEIHKYLAMVGSSYTSKLRRENDSGELIGMFGLGFLSAFALSRRVTVHTTSFQQPDQGWRYRSATGESYSVEPCAARAVGSEIRLELRDEYKHLAESGVLAAVLTRYCALLGVPVYVNDSEMPINATTPPWHEDRAENATVVALPAQLRRKRMAFAEAYEQRFHPICTIPVESDSVRGLLWVQDGGTYGTSDNRSLSVYVRGMLLDDDARDLLPHWAGFISGVIESPSLTPTASREDLQRDEHYRAAQNAIAEALISGLADIAAHEPEAWRRVLTRHNEALLGASLCDDRLFSLLANAVRLPTSRGELPAASLRVKGEVHLALQAESGFEAMLFRALQVPVAHGDRYGVAAFLRRWCHQFNAKLIEIGTASGDGSVFQPATLKDDEIDWLTQALGDGEKVIPVRFRPVELPFVVIIDKEARLKHLLESDEADRRISSAALRLIRAHTAKVDGSHTARLYVNLDNPSMRALLDARAAQPQGAARAAALLKAFKHITLASDETLKDGQSAQALRVIGESAIALLDAH